MADGSLTNAEDVLPRLLSQVWDQVVSQVNKLLEAHNRFGFVEFKAGLNPSLAEMLEGFKFVDFALTKLMENFDLQFDEQRNAINSKQCILRMQELSVALESGAQDEYDRIITELQRQSKF